jgi:thioredoxin reductase (NADPH)
MNEFDVVVVGAGPTGLACGIELKKRGLKTVLIEKGCVVNSLYNYPTNMMFFTTPELMEIGDIPMTSCGEKPTRTEALKYFVRVSDVHKLDIRQYQHVERVDGNDGAFVTHSRDRAAQPHAYASRKVVLATGYYDRPNRLNVLGEDLDKVRHYYKEPHPYYNQDVAVVGGKNSAVIAALELLRAGARVTLIHRGGGLSNQVKYWIRPDLENRIKSGEIKAHFLSRVMEITPDSILIEAPDGELTLKNDFVFAMIGYHPDIEFLAAHGISFDAETGRPYTNHVTLESARLGMHLAGVLVAGMHTNEVFIENGRLHGAKIADAIAGSLQKV